MDSKEQTDNRVKYGKRKRDDDEDRWSITVCCGHDEETRMARVTVPYCKYLLCSYSNSNSTDESNANTSNSSSESSLAESVSEDLSQPPVLDEPQEQTSPLKEDHSTDDKDEQSKADDSQLGEQTPHSIVSKKRRVKEETGKDEMKPAPLTPIRIRDIPLPAVSWADAVELSLLMCFREDIGIKERDPDVFRKHPNLTPRMRAILFDWIMEVCEVYKLRRVTYYLAIDYVDRYLSRIDILPKHQLQLLGITSLFIAAKVEEVYPPKLMELAYVTDGACTEQEMLLTEMAILTELRWDVNPMTVSSWLYLYLQMCYGRVYIRDPVNRATKNDEFIFPQYSGYMFMRASQLIDLCSLDDGMLQFQYSVIAASVVYYVFNREKALYVSGFVWEKIQDCVEWMSPFAAAVNRTLFTTPQYAPKESHRAGSGLKKYNANINLDESHTIQTHSVDLKMLEDVYSMLEQTTDSPATDNDQGMNPSSPNSQPENNDVNPVASDN